MCLTLFAWSYDPSSPFILLSNRDEYHHRPHQGAHFWSNDNEHIFAGKDLKSGGTWLGASKNEKLSTITNFREPCHKTFAQSRGLLTLNFLKSKLSAALYLKNLQNSAHLFAGFNLLLLDYSGLWYATNRQKKHGALYFKQLPPGIYGLCNHLLDTPWPKLSRMKGQFTRLLNNKLADSQPMLNLMTDPWQPEKTKLPNTGMPLAYEQLRSSCFIQSPEYGTQFTSYIRLDNNQLQWTERKHLPDKNTVRTQHYEIPFSNYAS